MKNYLAFFLILCMTAASAHGPLPARLTGPSNLVRVGLTDNDTTAGGTARLCEQISFSRGLRYGDSEANVLDQLTDSELRGQVAEAIAGLSERLQLVVQLYFVEELNLSEIAGVLEVSIPRVHQLKAQALEQLRKALSGVADIL